jgi:hypothetical protein
MYGTYISSVSDRKSIVQLRESDQIVVSGLNDTLVEHLERVRRLAYTLNAFTYVHNLEVKRLSWAGTFGRGLHTCPIQSSQET